MRKSVLGFMAAGSVLAITSAFALTATPFTPGNTSVVIPQAGSGTYVQTGCDVAWGFAYHTDANNDVDYMTASAPANGAQATECGLGGSFTLNEVAAGTATYVQGDAGSKANWKFDFASPVNVTLNATAITGAMNIVGHS